MTIDPIIPNYQVKKIALVMSKAIFGQNMVV